MSEAEPPRVTALLARWRAGDPGAAHELLPIVHHELRRIARCHMAGERRGHVLQTTALVNEAYLRLVGARRMHWRDRTHFLAMAARLMRRVLVDVARAERNLKRGGGLQRVTFEDGLPVACETRGDVLAIDAALAALAVEHPRKSQVVELRFFGGLTVEEAADALGISPETAFRDWRFAKTWLLRVLTSEPARRAASS